MHQHARSAVPEPSRAGDIQDFFFPIDRVILEDLSWKGLSWVLVFQESKEWSRPPGLHIFGLKQEMMCPAVCCCTCSCCQLCFWPRDTQADRVKLSTMHQGEQPQCLFFLQLPSVSIPNRDSQNILDQEVFPLENAILSEIKQELIQISVTVFGLEKSKHYILIAQFQFLKFWLPYHNTILFY